MELRLSLAQSAFVRNLRLLAYREKLKCLIWLYSTQAAAQHKAGNSHNSNERPIPMATPTLYSWSDIEIEQLNPLLQRQFVHGTQAMLTRFYLTKGCVIPRHSHPNEQISFIVD